MLISVFENMVTDHTGAASFTEATAGVLLDTEWAGSIDDLGMHVCIVNMPQVLRM